MPGYDHNRHIRVVTFDHFEDINPVHPAVFQPDIKDHQCRWFGVDLGHAFIGITCKTNGITLVLKDVSDQFADIAFVVNNQNACHNLYLSSGCFTAA